MAYMNQEKKATIAPTIKTILKKYGIKGSLSVRNKSTLVLNIKSSPIDFIGNYSKVNETNPRIQVVQDAQYINVNPYSFRTLYSGVALDALTEIFMVLNTGNHDRSDSQSDYFDVGWYVAVNVGQWETPYILL